MNKSALIYEFNKNSPLFAKVASEELKNKNTEKALEILEHGIKLYPQYPTAYIIYAQVLASVGDFNKAFEMLKIGCNLTDSDETYKFYSEKLENLKTKNQNISESRRATFIPEEFEETLSDENDQVDEIIIPEPIEESQVEEPTDDLEMLASELENATMPTPEIEPIEEELLEETLDIDDDFLSEETNIDLSENKKNAENKEKEIVSETLAGIYFAQGSLEEALTIYQKLLIYQPEKEAFFRKRIEEITQQLKNDPLI